MRLSLQHLRTKTVRLGVCQDLVKVLCFPEFFKGLDVGRMG